MAIVRAISPLLQFEISRYNTKPEGWLLTFLSGTKTPVRTYKDVNGALNDYAIHLNYRGECDVWLDSTKSYRFELWNESRTEMLWRRDDVTAPGVGVAPALNTDVIKWSDVQAVQDSDYSEFTARIAADLEAGIVPMVIDDKLVALYHKFVLYAGTGEYKYIFRTLISDYGYCFDYCPSDGTVSQNYPIVQMQNGIAVQNPDTGIVEIGNTRNCRNLTYTYTGSNSLDFVVRPIDGTAINFAVKITSTSESDGTVTVSKLENGLYIPLMPSVAGGDTVEAGKTYQLTCVGDCWTLAEFEDSTADYKMKVGNKLYKVVKIGSLYWMAENLAYDATAETGDLDSASIWYDNDSSTYGDYGKLYAFTDAARAEILAAAPGWRFPTQAEMAALFTESVADLKSVTGWTNAGTDGTGFSGVPGGKYFEGAFSLYGTQGQWWCVPSNDPLTAVNQYYLTDDSKGTAFVGAASYASVRLVKDVT